MKTSGKRASGKEWRKDRRMKSRAFRAASVLAAVVALCVGMNMLAPLIDTPAMRVHAAEGVDMIYGQGATPQLVGGFKSAQLDNYTAALMVKTAAYTGREALLRRMFGGYRVDALGEDGGQDWGTFCTYVPGESVSAGIIHYERYWHGYTLPLRLALCVMNLANIQMVLLFVQMVLMLDVLRLMEKRGLRAWIPGFGVAVFLQMPFATGICLQYVPVTLLTFAACEAVLRYEEAIRRGIGLGAFFALLGILTNYADLLTAPLVVLGFPLVLLMLTALRSGKSAGELLQCCVLSCAAWGVGYGGMWLFKGLIDGLVFGSRAVTDMLNQVKLRVSTDADGEIISRLEALRVNLGVILDKQAYRLLLAGTALGGLYRAVAFTGKAGKRPRLVRPDVRALALLVPAAVVLLWHVVMANHTYQHYYFTYRNWTVCVLAGYACLYGLWREPGRAV